MKPEKNQEEKKMTTARAQQIHIEETPYYHCVSRCVRRAFLCGDDPVSGQNFDHRKRWIVKRIEQLSQIFCIDVCAYAVMSNHYHVVLHVDESSCKKLDNKEVINRWTQLFSGDALTDKYNSGELSRGEQEKAEKLVEVWRNRLMDISWFMRCLNESIARQSNKEDNCTGRFWEGRFKCQALLDETALLTCMMYVDLNPVRAGIANSPEKSHFTSIKERISAYSKKVPSQQLLPFEDEQDKHKNQCVIKFSFKDYITLLRWACTSIHNKKPSNIPHSTQEILNKLGTSHFNLLSHIQNFEKHFHHVVGPPEKISRICNKLGLWWIRGSSNCHTLYASPRNAA